MIYDRLPLHIRQYLLTGYAEVSPAKPTAAQRRLKAWSRMTSKQKLADMEKEDRRRKRGRK